MRHATTYTHGLTSEDYYVVIRARVLDMYMRAAKPVPKVLNVSTHNFSFRSSSLPNNKWFKVFPEGFLDGCYPNHESAGQVFIAKEYQ